MSSYLRDIPSNALISDLVTVRTVTTTVTGSYVDMITGDGRCTLIADVKATSITFVSVKIQQSTLTNSGFADVSGAIVTATTDGVSSVSFDRDKRYVLAIVGFSGTTANVAALALEQLKQF